MINSMQMALIKKDIRSITANRNLFITILIVPFIMAVVIPSAFILVVGLTPVDSPSFQDLAILLPEDTPEDEIHSTLNNMLINSIIPIFFLIIPAMAASVMSASSFIGEKEKQTLETLLYCPLSLKQIFNAKIVSSFVFSQVVSVLSFVVMVICVQSELWFISKSIIPLGLSWVVLLLLLSPSLSLAAITLIVRTSAKAKSVEEAQQRSVFVILPIIFLAAGQFSGLTASIWLMLGFGAACAIIGFILLRRASLNFTYERLLL